MSILTPSNMESADYGSDGWNAIYTANFEKLNNHLGTAMKAAIPKSHDFEIIGSTNDATKKALVVYNSDDEEIFSVQNDNKVFVTSVETRIGGSSNYMKVDSDGTPTLVGDATVWDDLLVPNTATKLGGYKDPVFAVFKTNGSGSQGVFLYWFDSTSEEELYFVVQMPHCWKEGTTIYPHVHWTPATTADGDPADQKVRWGLEYSWANIEGDFGNTTLITGEDHTPADANVVAGRHYLTKINGTSGIDGTGKTISSILACRVYRDATHANDTYEHDAGLLHIDFHYEIDSLGSGAELTK